MTLCELCGINEATQIRFIPLWSYGVRQAKNREVCKRCATAHDKGEL